jgi:signal transduction histidine kinase
MNMWLIGGLASTVVTVCYFSISWIIAKGLTRTHQWGRNPLGVATCAIFLTCGIGHGLHAEHLLLGASGTGQTAIAVQEVFGAWHVITIDLITAVVGVWYLNLRHRYAALLSVSVFEDVDERQRTALEVNDDIIQGLVTARLALELDDPEEAKRGIDQALTSSREVMDRLMEPINLRGGARGGDLRRQRSARPS